MALYLDSAILDEARQASTWGLVSGATTNPTLMAKANAAAEEVIAAMCDLLPGTIFYQVTAASPEEREDEARRMAGLRPGRVGLKIPCTFENLALCSRLAKEGYTCGITTIFSAAQVYLAVQAGARYVLPYVNRSTRLQGDGLALVREMRAVIDAGRSQTQIMAASLRTPSEVVDTIMAGAHHVTVPFALIQQMGQHDLSDQAIQEFARASAAV